MRRMFFILGAPKCGTTSLYSTLRLHPDICMSEPKEPAFFEVREEYRKGLEFYWNHYFAVWDGERIGGEANPSHLFLPWVPQRIRESVPDAKLVVILRNPIERAYSAWLAHWRSDTEGLSFEAAVEDNLRRLESGVTFTDPLGERLWCCQQTSLSYGQRLRVRTYVDTGYYAEQLKRYLALFDPAAIHVVFLEDLACKPIQVLHGLLEFLGVTSESLPLKAIKENQAIRREAVASVRLAHRLGLVWLLPMSLQRTIRRILSDSSKKPRMNLGVRASLQKHFRPHNEALARLLGHPLPGWDM
jgi:hypothetical protein